MGSWELFWIWIAGIVILVLLGGGLHAAFRQEDDGVGLLGEIGGLVAIFSPLWPLFVVVLFWAAIDAALFESRNITSWLNALFSWVLIPTLIARSLGVVGIAAAVIVPWIAVRAIVSIPETGTPTAVMLRPELVVLPGGTFMMGSHDGDGLADERPRHAVTVSSFAVSRTEVTVAQYEAVMGVRPSDCAYGCEDDMPIQNVSWEDAVRYANRLTEQENALRPERTPMTQCYDESTWAWDRDCTGYRLPTEAEWEYAARAGTVTEYSFGEDRDEICKHGNVIDGAGAERYPTDAPAGCDDGYTSLAPVGRFLPNRWGLHDMHGNVSEWVYDGYSAEFYGQEGSTVRDPVNSGTGASGFRTLRGGGFDEGPEDARSAARGMSQRTTLHGAIGVRLVRGPTSNMRP